MMPPSLHKQPSVRWDLHLDADGAPAYNMAKDEYCLERTLQTGRPSLRLYGWDRLALSLGRAQNMERELDLAACTANGVELVRRITGGRAVLHGSDLTYAVTAPTALPAFSGGILSIYREISRALVAFLRSLGCEPQVKAYTARERARLSSPICFVTPSAFEILADGRKLIGSAQRRLPRAFLQHGSIPLAPQAELLARLVRGAAAEALRGQMTDLETLGVIGAVSISEVRQRLVQAFSDELGAAFQPAQWGDDDAVRVLRGMGDYPPPQAQRAAPEGPAGRPPSPRLRLGEGAPPGAGRRGATAQ